MYQPSHFTTEIGRMRAEEMRARAERYRTIQKAKQHKTEPEEEETLSRSRTFVYRRALGIAGLSVLMVLAFAATALAMPAEAIRDRAKAGQQAPTGLDGNHQAVDDKHQALVSKGADVPTRTEIQHLVPGAVGGQARAETQHLAPGAVGGQERAAIQHVGEADQPSTFNPAPGLTPSSGGIELEMVLLLTALMALGSAGVLLWFRRETLKQSRIGLR